LLQIFRRYVFGDFDLDYHPINQYALFQCKQGKSLRLYVQCCESEDLLKHSTPLYNAVIIRPGEYFEGEEQMDVTGDEVVSFDIITNLRLIRDPNTTQSWKKNFFTTSEELRYLLFRSWWNISLTRKNTVAFRIAYLMDVRRMHCNEFEPSTKRKRKINWP
uniref:Uncharacterized protein n=1 Tax=Parascaris equorum TaxID=6256 RepID=A0A914RA11_PAREQ